MRTCPKCDGPIVSMREDAFRYTAAGLNNVVLEGITVHRCTQCGSCAPAIPNILGLHRTLARRLASAPRPLCDKEKVFLVRFLQSTELNRRHRAMLTLANVTGRAGGIWAMIAEFTIRALVMFASGSVA